ncbi:hypothetical protein GW17_00052013 [Ensete ventricosum]|nr:hypothetical protein GW17_00052013 [Ensete ventricosum]
MGFDVRDQLLVFLLRPGSFVGVSLLAIWRPAHAWNYGFRCCRKERGAKGEGLTDMERKEGEVVDLYERR